MAIEISSQIASFTGPTWGPPGSCRPQMGPMLAPWSLLSGVYFANQLITVYIRSKTCLISLHSHTNIETTRSTIDRTLVVSDKYVRFISNPINQNVSGNISCGLGRKTPSKQWFSLPTYVDGLRIFIQLAHSTTWFAMATYGYYHHPWPSMVKSYVGALLIFYKYQTTSVSMWFSHVMPKRRFALYTILNTRLGNFSSCTSACYNFHGL